MKHPAERAAEIVCTLFLIFAVLYITWHVYAAAMRGSFEVNR